MTLQQERGWNVKVDRRSFLVMAAGIPAAMWMPRSASAAIGVATYHNASAADHQKQFDAADGLKNKGYRIRSLSVFRQGSEARYAAVWTTESGPAWQAFHNLAGSAYQAYFDKWTAKGYRPIIVTATGGGVIGVKETISEVFAGVFIQDSTPYLAKHGIDLANFKDTCAWAKSHQYILRWATIYGGKSRLCAGIWEQVAGSVSWDHELSVAIDGPEIGLPLAMKGKRSLKLSFITRSPFAEYLGVYRSDVSGDWKERHGLTSSEFQKAHDDLKAQGYFPWCLQAGGDPRVTGEPRYVCLFRKL